MKPRARSRKPAFAAIGAALALAAVAALAAEPQAWQATSADVRVVCPMTIGGSFEARTASLAGTLTLAEAKPVALAGDLVVDLRTLDTGIGLRNTHLREKYLEVGKGQGFDHAVLSDIRLPGANAESVEGRTPFTGSLALHGTTRPVKGEADVHREGGLVRVQASFPLRVSDYGIEKPQYLGVGVKDEVQVKVSLRARPAPPAPGGSR